MNPAYKYPVHQFCYITITYHHLYLHTITFTFIRLDKSLCVSALPCCSYNMLKLPNYKRAATLKQKLLYAIGAGAGFELS